MSSVCKLRSFVRVAEEARSFSLPGRIILNHRDAPVSIDSAFPKTEGIVSVVCRCLATIQGVVSGCFRRVWGLSSTQKVENRRVWAAFIKCLHRVYGQDKIHRVSGRYQMDLNARCAEGTPLCAEDVKRISIGCSRIVVKDVESRAHQRLNALTCAEIKQVISKHSPIIPMGKSFNPLNIYGAPLKTRSWIHYNPVLMDKELFYLCSDVKKLTFKEWMERFCKCIVNRELTQNQIIPVPGAQGSVEYYQVHRKIGCNGLIAYGLTPLGSNSTLQPCVIFRPTQFPLSAEDSLETFMNDFQINIGEWGYSSARNQLKKLIKDRAFCPSHQRVVIGGYSLGGAFAQRFMADHWKRISHAFFFNSPSVDAELAEKFAKRVNASPSHGDPIRMRIFRSSASGEGDVAHIVGGKHLGWGIDHPRFQIKLTEYHYVKEFFATMRGRIWLHSRRVLDNDHDHFKPARVNPRKLNRHLDNESRGPVIFWYERARRVWGGTLYRILYVFRLFLKPLGLLRSAH